MMFGPGEFVLAALLIYIIITWIVPWILRWLIRHFYHIEACIGRIGIPYLTLHDVHVSVGGFTFEIDQIGFRSSFLSSEVTKLLSVVIRDIRINKDVDSTDVHSSWKAPQSFQNLKIPPLLTAIAQFVSIRVSSITCAVKRGECLAHSTLNSVHLEASVVHNGRRETGKPSLLVTISLGSATTRLLRPSKTPANEQPCLAHIHTTLALDATLVANPPLSVLSVSISLSNIKTVINDDFYTYFNLMQVNQTSKKSSTSPKCDINSFLDYISPVIPKKLSIRFDDCIFTDNLDRDLTTLQKFYVDSTFTHLPHKSGIKANASLQLLVFGLDMKSEAERQFSLNKLSFDASLFEKRISATLTLNTCSSTIDQNTINRISGFSNSRSDNSGGFSTAWLPDLEYDLRVVLTNVSSAIKVPDLTKAVIGFTHFKFLYNSNPQIVDDMYESLIECLWCQLHRSEGCTISSLRKEHYWGSSLYLGFVLVKGNPSKVDAKLDILRIEWSPPFAVILSLFLENLPSKFLKNKTHKKSSNKLSFNITLTNSNYFFIADNKVCLMLRMDSCRFERVSSQEKVTCSADGTKFCSILPTSSSFICLKSSDIKTWYGNFDIVKLEWREKHKILKIKFSKEINFVWSPNLHLKIREVMMELLKFWKHVKYKGPSKVPESRKIMDNQIHISLVGHIKVVVKLSTLHYLTLVTDDFSYMISQKECVWSTSQLRIAVDSADIFTLEQLHFTTLADSEYIRVERKNSEGFILPWNRTWSISMKSIKAVFPYEHAFCIAIQDELVSIFKWLKKLHKKASIGDTKLPPDLFIKIKEVVLEVSDDPFEVRLRDNYELLVDEYKESLMRQKKLEQKVSEMYKTHLLIPSGKLNELYANLSRVNAQIYVQRSRRIQEQGTRTRLLAWIVSDLQLLAMADPTLHSTDNVLANMTSIDPSSPWPEEGLQFSTLWCRSIVAKCNELKFQLRDFPQPWVDIGQLNLWGRLVGAEQSPTRRAKRVVNLELGDPWDVTEIERSMTSLKFYHDFNMEVEHFSYAFGPCWEPVIAQCNISFEKIVRPSLDPSPPLPLWDKLRLILHGRLTAIIKQMTVLLHASLDPYNTTEEMEITWTNLALDWTSAKIIFKGNLDIYVRTASKYDDCRLLHLPNLKLGVKLGWECLGDPNDHHSVMPCAPDKLPDYSSNQEHDSFRAFRSQSLNVSLALETKPVAVNRSEIGSPVALLYGSTLRWFENLKLILSGVTRPIRRGTVFGANVRPRKIPLSRHYKKVHLLLSLHSFQVHYWMSFAMQRGFELTAETISFSSEHLLSLVPILDGLIHRNRSEWSVIYMTCELHNAEIWLRSALPEELTEDNLVSIRPTVEKCYFLSVGKVSYGREGSGPTHGHGVVIESNSQPTHRLVVYGLKAAWTMSNRDVVFALYDTFMKTKQLKKNLCPESLKGFRNEARNISLKARPPENQPSTSQSQNTSSSVQATPSPMSKLQCGHAATMLQQLIAEVDTKAVVFSDEPTTEPSEQPLIGLAACQHVDDIAYNNWSIALVNSQVLLKGPETKGYVIISTEKAEILQRIHRPVWRDMTLVAKTTWVGSLQSVQYYATVNADQNDTLDENIMWLSVDNIKEKDDCIISGLPDLPQLVGSGQSVGGVVSETVGATSADDHNSPLQLQRIVSRCKCEFFYASYGESSMSPSTLETVPAPPLEDAPSLWEPPKTPIDAFTLMHHDLDVCTNSLQYAMLLDIVNNLLLYVDVERKERYERLQRMRFQLQLQSVEDQRKPILEAQTRVRSLLSQLRGLEKEMYLVQRALQDEPDSIHLTKQIESIERQVNNCKETVNFQSEELDMMLSCYKETQLRADQKLAALRGDKTISIVRANEICFKSAQWRLTEADGQLGIADLILSNFLYTKNSKSDDSVEHLLEIGYVHMKNLLPNQVYKEVLQPTEIHNNMPVDRKRAIRVFCREKAPVGGISIMEHFEINVVPLTIELTKKFYQTMLKFCFPERDTDDTDLSDESDKKGHTHSRGKETSFYVPIERKDDVEKMKERAEKNKLFIYIKIPEVPVKVSYKGNKEKNLSDLRDLSLVIPTLEYHNVTWTWLDLLLAMKSDSKSVIVSQAIKHKLQIKSMRRGNEEGFPLEEDKAKILFGTRHMPGESKGTIKKSFFKFSK